jgi:cobalamin biosynthetic protein CobC
VAGLDVDGLDCLVLCNPNNPDGATHAPARLLDCAGMLAARGGWLVADEAFADFAPPGLSLAPHLPAPGIVVLRSFGKAYGLAGLRLGFALASSDLAARLRAALGPWPVSGPALAIGTAALADAAWREAARIRLLHDAERLDALLAGAGFAVSGGTPLFRLAHHRDTPRIAQRLGAAGILVRDFPETPDRLRLGIPAGDEAFARLAAELG